MCSIKLSFLFVCACSYLLLVDVTAYIKHNNIDFEMQTKTCIVKTSTFQSCIQKYSLKLGTFEQDGNSKDSNKAKAQCCGFWDLIEV